MRQLSFKTPAYRVYAPWLYKLTHLRSWIETIGTDVDPTHLTAIYWDRYLARRFVEEAEAIGGVPAPSVAQERRSDRVFLLGCGASIADIPASIWEKLERFDTIGINYFYFHPFRPRYHFIELGKSVEALHALYDILLNAQERKQEQVFLQIRHLLFNDIELKCDKNRSIIYSPTTLRTRDPMLLANLLRRYYVSGNNREPLIHHSSNLDCAINFAARQGYKEIFLLGVDLYGNQYFWDVDETSRIYARAKSVVDADYAKSCWSRQAESLHATANDKIVSPLGFLDISSYLRLVDQVVLQPAGIELAVCNPKSLLVNSIRYRDIHEVLD